MPGTAEQKRPLIECMSCHTLERVVRSKFTADEFVGVLKRMANYANNSTIQAHVQPRMVERDGARRSRPQGRRISRDRESEQRTEPLGLRAQDAAAADRRARRG